MAIRSQVRRSGLSRREGPAGQNMEMEMAKAPLSIGMCSTFCWARLGTTSRHVSCVATRRRKKRRRRRGPGRGRRRRRARGSLSRRQMRGPARPLRMTRKRMKRKRKRKRCPGLGSVFELPAAVALAAITPLAMATMMTTTTTSLAHLRVRGVRERTPLRLLMGMESPQQGFKTRLHRVARQVLTHLMQIPTWFRH